MGAASKVHRAIRCSTPGRRTAGKLKYGIRFNKKPIKKIRQARTASLRSRVGLSAPAAARRPKDRAIDTPPINRKKGKMVSVKVQPFHFACSSWGYRLPQSPG